MEIDLQTGAIRINDQFSIPPKQSAQEFLDSDLFRSFSMDKTTLESLEIQNRVILKIPQVLDLDWYFALDFKKLMLRSVWFYLVRHSMEEIHQKVDEDLELYEKLLKESFGDYQARKNTPLGLEYRFPWGGVKAGTYPDNYLAKVIVVYKKGERKWMN